MRKVIAYELLSLDDVAEDPDAFINEWDSAMGENLGRVISTQDTVLLGRQTCDDWTAFWPTSTIEPFASFINSVEKFVVTSTPLALPWSNLTVVDIDLAEFVTELKGRSGGDIGVHGSIKLCQSLLEAGLVDELRLVIAPAIQMSGRRLFDTAPSTRMTLTRGIVSPTGHLLVDYAIGA